MADILIRPVPDDPAVSRSCRRCLGTGREPLAPHLKATLKLIHRMGSATARQLEDNGVGITAINNRLEQLRRLGMVGRHKQGRCWFYSVTTTKTTK